MLRDIYVVLKRWDYENTAVMKAFVDEEDAKEFVKECFESGIYGEGYFYIEKSILAEGNSFDEFVIQEMEKDIQRIKNIGSTLFNDVID